MSRQNVEIVRSIYPTPEVDLVPLVRNDDHWRGFAEAISPAFHPDVVCHIHVFGGEKRYVGLEGVREYLLEWIAPWTTYRTETERTLDLGGRVLTLDNDRGTREGRAEEVKGRVANIWFIRDGKIACVDGYTTHEEAFRDLGVKE
jgi:ketosteroid isomerase-like protein